MTWPQSALGHQRISRLHCNTKQTLPSHINYHALDSSLTSTEYNISSRNPAAISSFDVLSVLDTLTILKCVSMQFQILATLTVSHTLTWCNAFTCTCTVRDVYTSSGVHWPTVTHSTNAVWRTTGVSPWPTALRAVYDRIA